MYELIQLSEHDYYIDCPAKMGIIKINDDEVIMIDSGNDKDAAKKALRIIEGNNWKLTAILNTHSHADHIGGNKYLQDHTGCKIYASKAEAAIVNNPIFEPTGLLGGYPYAELCNKFLMAQESHCEILNESILPEGMSIISLPGHSFEMCGFITPDGNAFIADCVSSTETLDKYKLTYLWDIKASLETLEYIKTLDVTNFVPSHAAVTNDITELADINIAAINTISSTILDICKTPLTFDSILKKVFEVFNLRMNSVQYSLIGSTARSYLSYLKNAGMIESIFEDNFMFWHTA